MIGVAALLLACGCPDDLLDAVYRRLESQAVPGTPSAAVAQVRAAIAQVQSSAEPPPDLG